jgi:hypothetical protein
MKTMHLKILLLFAAFIFLSFHHNFKSLHKGMQRYNRHEPDQITMLEKRLAEIKAVLQNQAIVGYVSDYEDHSDEEWMAYTRIQYVLAPIILVRGLKPNFVICNFQHTQPDIEAYQKEDLSLRRDFGNGVILFERLDS